MAKEENSPFLLKKNMLKTTSTRHKYTVTIKHNTLWVVGSRGPPLPLLSFGRLCVAVVVGRRRWMAVRLPLRSVRGRLADLGHADRLHHQQVDWKEKGRFLILFYFLSKGAFNIITDFLKYFSKF